MSFPSLRMRTLAVAAVTTLICGVFSASKADAKVVQPVPVRVDLTYMFSDVSLIPCTFPVLVHEVGLYIYSGSKPGNFVLHGPETVTFTNLDTGYSVVTYNAGNLFYGPETVIYDPVTKNTTVTYHLDFTGLNFRAKTETGTVILAGLSRNDYTFVIDPSGRLVSWSIVEVNTRHTGHSSNTICDVLA